MSYYGTGSGFLNRLSLRVRVFAFFLLLGVAVPVVVGGALYLALGASAENPAQDLASLLFLYGGGATVILVLLVVGVGLLFDINMATPIQSLVRDLQTVIYANPEHAITLESARHLGMLPEAVDDLARSLAEARSDTARQVAEATAAERQTKLRLEALLRDLHTGVIMCNLNHRILLYNQIAVQLLHLSGPIGLDRPLFTLLNRQPFLHALERLTNRFRDGRHKTHPQGLTASFICATTDGRYVLEATMSLIVDDEEMITGYVLSLDDVTEELEALGRRDHLLRDATQGFRRPLANIRAAGEILADHPGMPEEKRRAFERVVVDESLRLSEELAKLTAAYHSVITGHWPMTDIYSANLLNLVVRRARDEGAFEAVMTGLPRWLHGDSHSLVEVIDLVLHRVKSHLGVDAFDLECRVDGDEQFIDIGWRGEAVAEAEIAAWRKEPLPAALGGLTLREVLEHHQSDLWCEAHRDGQARIRMPVPAAKQEHADTLPAETSRPEFYDFSFLDSLRDMGDKGEISLRELTYVVFDTETTGLRPSDGDEMISIAGVRIVNGRILTGESFSQLIRPGQPIPKASIKFHGITDEMVKDKPPASVVLPRFHEFVRGAVLVAHNAAFDLKFLKLREEETGVEFDNPVLDTLLLSAFLHDHTSLHTLDAAAERFNVAIQGRHTALGDSLVTAEVFLGMVDLLEARGVTTLNEAIAATETVVQVKKMQAQF